jgi:isopenicillin-N epimerase
MAANRALALEGRDIVCAALGVAPPAPEEEAIGSMATIVLPRRPQKEWVGGFDPLTERLRDRWAVEVPVFRWRDWPHSLLRVSAQLYNTRSDYERLAEAVAAEIEL